jgi:hypothetical protein
MDRGIRAAWDGGWGYSGSLGLEYRVMGAVWEGGREGGRAMGATWDREIGV